MIHFENVYKRFGKLDALNHIDLHLEAGQCIALIGPNGCGKTTLIKSLLGMVIPEKGVIRLDGNDCIHQHLHRTKLGYMPQIGRYPGNLTIGQLIDMVRNLRPTQSYYDEDLINTFCLKEMATKKMSTLSGGTVQKVSAAIAFLFDPPILVLDEPTAGLDPVASEALKQKIEIERNKGKLILITSHILSELDDLVTQIVFMQEGKILFHKNLAQLQSETGEVRISKAIVSILKKVP